MNSNHKFKLGAVLGFITACTTIVGCSIALPQKKCDSYEIEVEIEGITYRGIATVSQTKGYGDDT